MRRKKILIVDDEFGVREYLSEKLQLSGYETFTAADGQEGMDVVLKVKPDLILLDILMPIMDGWKMLSCLREQENTRDIPVVMLTARGETESLFKSQARRALDYFIKPVDTKELLAFIKKYIDLSPNHPEEDLRL